MPNEDRSKSTPPPLPEIADSDFTNVEPPPLIEEAKASLQKNVAEVAKVQPSTDEAASQVANQIVEPTDPTQQFLARAGAAIALERGINARSRVKLAAIADEIGLSDDEFATAMEQLQRGGASDQKQLTREELRDMRRRKRAFHHHVGETLMALPQGVLTSSMETQLIDAGVKEHGFSEEEALADVLHLAKQLRIRRITLAEAQRHIAELTDYAVKPHGILRDDVRQRIVAEGARWGLTPDQVEPIVKQRLSQARQGQRSDQMRMTLLISASAAVLVGVLGMVAWMAFSRALPDAGPDTDTTAQVDDGESASDGRSTTGDPAAEGAEPSAVATPPKRFAVPDWWTAENRMSELVASVRIRMPSLESACYQIRSPDADDRTDAYVQLLNAVNKSDLNEQTILSGLLAAAYASDPSDVCAQRLQEAWSNIAASPADTLGQLAADYDFRLWIADTAALALLHPGLSAERRTELLHALDRAYGTTLDSNLSGLQLRTEVLAASGSHLYKMLSRHAAKDVDIAVDLHREILARVGKHLTPAARDRLGANYLRQVLPELQERWPIYEDLIRRCALSEDPLNVLLMLEVFETTEVAALQSFLATQLVVRTGLSATRRTVDELAAAVREELGVSRAPRTLDSAERYAQWRDAAEQLLAEDPPAASDSTELLQHIVDTTRLATLGAALAHGELGSAEFEALWDVEPQQIGGIRRSATARPRGPRPSTLMLRNLDKNVDYLAGYRRLERGLRLNYLRAVSGYAGSVTDVTAEQGQHIAAYLAAPKSVDEHERVMAVADGVLRWRMVRLGLADQMVDSRLRNENLGELVGKALHREVDVDEDGWRQRLRDELLAAVERELASEASLASVGLQPPDRAAQAITDYYRTQAKLDGVAPGAYQAAGSPADLLRLLIQQQAVRLPSAGLAADARQRVENIPQELEAVDYVAENDVARTARLQRILLDLMEKDLTHAKRERSADLQELQQTLLQKDNEATHVLSQLAAGERALLKYWLIRNRP